jgi:hypothetical protein
MLQSACLTVGFALVPQDPPKRMGASNVFSSVIQKLEQQYVVRSHSPTPLSTLPFACSIHQQYQDVSARDSCNFPVGPLVRVHAPCCTR